MFDDLIPKNAPQGSGVSFDDLVPPEQAARAELAKGLREGRRGDAEIYKTASFRTNQGVKPAGMTDAAIQEATGGLSDEISAGARAPIDMLMRGESYDEAYQHNLAAERDRLEQYKTAHPVASTVAGIAGGLAMPVSKATGAIKAGAGIGAVSGFGHSEGDLAGRAGDAAVGGAVGGAAGAALSGVGKLIGGKTPSTAPSIADLKDAAKAGYNSAEVVGLEIRPQGFRNFGGGTAAKLSEEGFDPVLAPKTFGLLGNLEKIPENVSITGRNIETLRKSLGKAAASADPTERAAASSALEKLRNFSEEIPASDVLKGDAAAAASKIKEANANYAAAKQSEKIDQKTIQAEIRAAAANSGMNVGNTIRQRMADLLINEKQRRGLTPDEIAIAEKISRGTRTQNAVRMASNVLGGGGGLGSVVAAGVGGLATGGPGALAPVAGFALKALNNKITVRQAEKLSEAIRSRAPLASANQKFEEKAAEFIRNRTAKTSAAAALAARNLANNLRGSGINVSAAELFGGLKGIGYAEDQPEIPRPPSQ